MYAADVVLILAAVSAVICLPAQTREAVAVLIELGFHWWFWVLVGALYLLRADSRHQRVCNSAGVSGARSDAPPESGSSASPELGGNRVAAAAGRVHGPLLRLVGVIAAKLPFRGLAQ